MTLAARDEAAEAAADDATVDAVAPGGAALEADEIANGALVVAPPEQATSSTADRTRIALSLTPPES